MAYLTITRFDGEPEALLAEYHCSAAVMDAVGHDHGLMLHAVARSDHGLLVVNLWPSRDNSEAAASDSRRLAALQRASAAIAQLRREHHELERYFIAA